MCVFSGATRVRRPHVVRYEGSAQNRVSLARLGKLYSIYILIELFTLRSLIWSEFFSVLAFGRYALLGRASDPATFEASGSKKSRFAGCARIIFLCSCAKRSFYAESAHLLRKSWLAMV